MLVTERLQLLPLPAAAAAVLPEDRAGAATLIGASVHDDWPHAELLDMLPMQAAAQSEADELFGVWVIIERASASVVGDIGFFGPPDDNGVVEIGYSLVAPCRGHGYAGEAVRVLLDWVASQPGVLSVTARCEPGNAASIRVLERAGFVHDGVTEAHERWRLH